MSLTTFPLSALRPSSGYYTDVIGGGIGSVVVMTDGDPSGRTDDTSSLTAIALGFTFVFLANPYTQLWINNNGNVTFLGSFGPFRAGGPAVVVLPMIAPFFADVDTRNAASGVVHLRTDVPNEVIVTWDAVGYAASHADKLNSFQLVLRGPGYSIPAGEGSIGFFYKSMQWEAGDGQLSTAGIGGIGPPSIGFGDGAGNSTELVGSRVNGTYASLANHCAWFTLDLAPVYPPAPPPPEGSWGIGDHGVDFWGGAEGGVPAAGGGPGAIPVSRGPVLTDADDPLGVDLDVVTDLPPTFRLTRGRPNLANAIARRLYTPAGWLATAFSGDADYGFDVRGRLNSAWRADELAAAETHIEEQCRQDERVQSASVTVSQDLSNSALTVDISIEDADGPFDLVLRVTSVGIELLEPQ